MDPWTDRLMDGWKDKWMDGSMNLWMMDPRTEGWTHPWIDEYGPSAMDPLCLVDLVTLGRVNKTHFTCISNFLLSIYPLFGSSVHGKFDPLKRKNQNSLK